MDSYTGEIKLWPSKKIINNWMFCNGQTLNISEYSALYSLIGTKYGGDGVTTFALPNLAAKVVVGVGQLTGGQLYSLGQSGGVDAVTLQLSNLATHSHNVVVSTDSATSNTPTGNYVAAPNSTATSSPLVMFADTAKGGTMTIDTMDSQTLSVSQGGSQPHNNMMPYLVLNYIICINGLYPDFPN